MATLSENGDSWHARGIKRRDFRHVKGDPEVPGSRNRGRKNTKRWCKGKEGREHDVRTYVENPHACSRDCSYRKENGGTGFHPWGTNRRVTKCVACGMDSWNLDKIYKTNPIQQALADKWCGEGHLYDWMTDSQLTQIGLSRRRPQYRWMDWPSDRYEHHACVMCGKPSGKRARPVSN
jgi:hypothetical protein